MLTDAFSTKFDTVELRDKLFLKFIDARGKWKKKSTAFSFDLENIFQHRLLLCLVDTSTHTALNAFVDPESNQAISRIDSPFWQEAMNCTTMNQNRRPDSIYMEQQTHSVQRFSSTLCNLVYSRVVMNARSLDQWRLITFDEVKQHI